jgi:pSer/pThr/pTyr-binding forkhead associated (FHA) protein
MQAPVVRITKVTPSGTQVVNYTLRETKMTTIGRAPDNVIVINNLHISKYHCTIELIDGEYFLHDHSLNGSWLNGVKLMPNACGIMLHHDDVRARAPCANNCAACP